MKNEHHYVQCAIVSAVRSLPHGELLFHIENERKRNRHQAMWAKSEGLLSGVPDLFWPIPRGGYHGMFCEIKVGRDNLSQAQKWFFEQIKEQWYYCVVVRSVREGIDEHIKYLNLKG